MVAYGKNYRSIREINEDLKRKRSNEGLYEPETLLLESILVHTNINLLSEPFLANKRQLTEVCGRLSDIDSYIESIKGFIQGYKQYLEKVGKVDISMSEKNISVKNKFFDRCIIDMTLELNSTKKPDAHGYSETTWETDEETKQTVSVVYINVVGNDTNFASLQNAVSTTVAHELTHAYEDIQRHSHNSRTIQVQGRLYNYDAAIDMLRFGVGDNGNYDAEANEAVKNLGGFLYICYKPEVNAFVSEAYTEMMESDAILQTSSDAVSLMKNTAAFKNYQKIDKFVNHLPEITDVGLQNLLIEKLNSVLVKYNGSVKVKSRIAKNYNQFLNCINSIWNKVSKTYNEKLGKICYDVFKAKNNTEIISPSNVNEWIN